MSRTVGLPGVTALAAGLLLASCEGLFASSDRPETALDFPQPDRPVARVVSNQFADEDARDERDEARIVMDLADIEPGMTVADIGAGEGYYTVRLAERVGAEGRVLAQDIDWEALERLENISIKPGRADDPQLPSDSFDRIFLVHMYHEVTEPYAFLWRMWPALTAGGEIVVVETDRPAGSHGMPHALLFCEFETIGYMLIEYIERPDIKGYFARFGKGSARVEPEAIEPCTAS